MHEDPHPTDHARRLQARLQWEAACERLAFVLAPPDGTTTDGAPDLASAFSIAAEALQELRDAFAPGNPAPPI